ncbi:MAG: hypothetical protein U0Q03_06625 [Acidimicrobiales bacterium]
MTDSTRPTGETPVVGICGAGVTGQAVGRVARSRGLRVAWFDPQSGASVRASRRHGGVVLDRFDDLGVADVVVLTHPVGHAVVAGEFVDEGVHVVSVSDDHDDVMAMLSLHERAWTAGARMVVGAALSPGLTGLLARQLASQLAEVDEIHVAMHGTGGPACARQHHGALGGLARGWHDGEWIERPGGSGRELCWFPDPIGPADCYRAALADPVLLHRAFPQASRVSARVSATRRDRLTARLPMLAPPHAEGDRGAIRVEVRGALPDGARETLVVGAVGRTGDLAGAVAALAAIACLDGRAPVGVSVTGEDPVLSRQLLGAAIDCGVQLQEFTGVPRVSV